MLAQSVSAGLQELCIHAMYTEEIKADPISSTHSAQGGGTQLLVSTGESAGLKAMAAAALEKHKSEVIATLTWQHSQFRKLAKTAGHRRCRRQRVKWRLKVKKLRRRLMKQELHTRQLNVRQAQYAQRIQRLEHCSRIMGSEGHHKLMQLAEDVKEINVRHMELSSQVRANTRAQNLLTRLAGVIDELRTQLQVQL